MFDVQHDSPVPIHEQLTSQIRSHVASGALKAGALLTEYRAFAQELLTNPQVVARAYAELEAEGVLEKAPASGGMVVTGKAAGICRLRIQDAARDRMRQAIAAAIASGLADAEILKAVERELVASRNQPLSPDELLQAMKKPSHEHRDRDSQGIQDLSRQNRPGQP